MIRLATIGTSSISACMLDAANHIDEVVYVGALSRDAERAAAFTAAHGGTRAFSSLEEMASCDEVDAVYIASPNALHHDQALACIRGGKHVLIEKPLAANAREAREVFEAAREANVVALEAMIPVHHPAFQALRGALDELGPIRRITFRMGKYSSRYDEVLAGRHTNIFDCAMAGGALMDIGCYTVEPLIELFGAPISITAAAALLDAQTNATTGGPIDGAGVILARYEGMIASLHFAKNVNDLMGSQIEGERGTLSIDAIQTPASVQLDLREASAHGDHAGYSSVQTSHRAVELPTVDADMACELRDFAEAAHAVTAGAKAADAACGPFGTVGHFRDVTVASLELMDEARRQMGVTFPADR